MGKSRLALELACEFPIEIVTADSRQVYRYMDIGTAKPSGEERAQVPHHMLDLVAPDDTYSVQRFALEGLKVLRKIWAAGNVPMVVGGTGFYVQALLDGTVLPPVPPNEEMRTRLRSEVEALGPAVLHARLGAVDPLSAARIHPNNIPRVIRALEVVDALGGPVPQSRAASSLPSLVLGLNRERGDLHRIADLRVLAQIEAGLVDETAALLTMGYDPALPSLQGFGYRECVQHLAGDLSLDEAIALYQGATRRYIRRQMTWFRRDDRIRWLDASDPIGGAVSLIRSWLSRDR